MCHLWRSLSSEISSISLKKHAIASGCDSMQVNSGYLKLLPACYLEMSEMVTAFCVAGFTAEAVTQRSFSVFIPAFEWLVYPWTDGHSTTAYINWHLYCPNKEQEESPTGFYLVNTVGCAGYSITLLSARGIKLDGSTRSEANWSALLCCQSPGFLRIGAG